MAISFDQVPSNIRTPLMFTEFDSSFAVSGPQKQPFKVTLIGQRLANGSKVANDLSRVTSAKQAQGFYGIGSMLAEMCEVYFKNNSNIEMLCLAVDDLIAGVQASGSVKFSGAPTENGIAVFRIFSKKVSVSVSTTDTPATLATKLKAEIDGNVPSAVATIDVDTSKVIIKYVHKGLVGNSLDLRQGYYSDEKGLPAGVVATIVAMTGGAGNPDLTNALSQLSEEHFNVYGVPYTDLASLNLVNQMLAERFGATKQIEGMAFFAANLGHSPLGELGDSVNSKFLSIMDAHNSMSGPHLWAAALAGVVSFEMANDAAKPLQTVILNGIFVEETSDSFTMSERNLLLYDGISTHLRSANGDALIETLITTYKENDLGADDVAYLYVETFFQLSYIRYDWNNYVMRKYPRYKLADNGNAVAPGQPVMTPNLYKSELVNKYKEWAEIGYVENVEAFKNGLVVERDVSNTCRLNAWMKPDLMNQFRIGANKISFIL